MSSGRFNIAKDLSDPCLLRNSSLIDGEWVGNASTFDVVDPFTGNVIERVANMGSEQASQAVEAAFKSWSAWKARTAKERSDIMLRWFQLLLQHADDLACLITAEQGKPIAESKGEVIYSAGFVEWFAQEARRIYGEIIPTTDKSKRYTVIRQPIGVCVAITPWNFPIAMITRKVGPALAAGCSVIIKPAEQTPLSALAACELAQRAGIPPGVINILTADAANSVAIGKVLCESKLVRHFSFTGSTEVGRVLAKQCAMTVKKLSLELGGNAPFLVFDDADIEAAVEGAIVSKYRNAGQTCVCSNRFYVQASVYDRFVEKMAVSVNKLKIGDGFKPDVAIGPLIDEAALSKVEAHVAEALNKGAKIVVGGSRHGQNFYLPTVLSHVTHDMRCAREETFGPVAPVLRFETEDEAIHLANSNDQGLAGYLYSKDISRMVRVSEALEYGMVGINTGFISAVEVPFGGIKQSGLGREGGRHGIEDYLEMKYLCLGGIA